MANVFSSMKLIDRKNETETLLHDIDAQQSSDESKLVILWADSGLGKSSIVQKVKSSLKNDRPIITVETPPMNEREFVNNGDFLSYIAAEFDLLFKAQGWSLEKYLCNGLSNRQQKSEADRFFSSEASLPRTVFSLLCERILRLKSADSEKIINGADLDSILTITEYINTILEVFPLVLNITNLQNADSTSLKALQNALQNHKGLYFIFEYTTYRGDTENLWRLANMFSSSANVKLMEIDELPIEYALTIFSPNASHNISELERFYKEIAKGNIYKLINARGMLADDPSASIQEDPIAAKISKMTYADKLILAVICLHDGSISKELFNNIKSSISGSYFLPSATGNTCSNLVIETDTNYRVAHASVLDSFQLCAENHAALVGYKFVSDYYEKLLSDISETSEIYFETKTTLLRLYSMFDPRKLLNELQPLQKLLMASFSEAQGMRIISKIFESLSEDTPDEIKIHIVNLAYSVGFYQGAYKLLTSFQSENETYYLLKCMLLNRTDKHAEVFELCKVILKEKHHSVQFELIVKMIRMLSERSVNDSKAYKRTFRGLYGCKKYENIYEYGFLLRNSQIALSYSESLPYLENSILFFKGLGKIKDAACSSLTYLIQQSRLGNVTQGGLQLKEIEETLLNSTFEKHIILTNKAAIQLLSGDADDHTLLLLEESILTATTSFDRIAILNNKLCWYIANRAPARLFQNLKTQLEMLLPDEPDIRLHRRTFVNFAGYYSNVLNDDDQAHFWLGRAKKLSRDDDILGEAFIKKQTEDEELRFLLSKPFYISFITYWHFDLPML